MWIPSYHAFASRAAFLAACDAAGWARGPDGKPMPPDGATLVEIGPIVAPPTVGADGSPVPGDVLDARYHVNAAWHGTEPPEVFRAAAVTPTTPYRSFSLPSPPLSVEPSVPAVIPAWKGKAALREAGILNAAKTAIEKSGGRIQDAWAGAPEWNRDSYFLLSLSTGLGLSEQQVDEMFRDADAIKE